MFIDSHCHLDMLAPVKAGGSIDGVLAAAHAAGVSEFLCVGVHPDAQAAMLELVGERTGVWCSAGVHPSAEVESEPDVATIAAWCRDSRIVAVGETGLDYHYTDAVAPDRQRDRFRTQVRAARETGLPLIIHTREAEADTAEILTEAVGKGGIAAVLHCFTGSADLARTALDLGLTISMSGIVTFKNARELQETAKTIPLDRLLVETDSPFLAPVPHRGKTCEPAFVADTAAFLADLRGEPLDELAAATTANFFRLFAKAEP